MKQRWRKQRDNEVELRFRLAMAVPYEVCQREAKTELFGRSSNPWKKLGDGLIVGCLEKRLHLNEISSSKLERVGQKFSGAEPLPSMNKGYRLQLAECSSHGL
jgi:hypothetical protein